VVRGHSHDHRRGWHDLQQRHKQHHADLYRTSDAGQGDGPACCHRTRRNTDRRTNRRMVANHFSPRWALGIGAAAGFTAALAVGLRSGPPKRATARSVISPVKSSGVPRSVSAGTKLLSNADINPTHLLALLDSEWIFRNPKTELSSANAALVWNPHGGSHPRSLSARYRVDGLKLISTPLCGSSLCARRIREHRKVIGLWLGQSLRSGYRN
jgi:hypothetical protein